MVYLIIAKEKDFYYQRQKCATRCRFFYQTKKSSTRYRFCYQTQNLLPDAEFFYQTLGTQKNTTLGGILHLNVVNAQVTLPDVGIIYQTPQRHKVFTSHPVRPGCRLVHRMEVSTSRCTVFFLMVNCQWPRDSDNYIVPTGIPWCRGLSRIVGVIVWCWQVYKRKI